MEADLRPRLARVLDDLDVEDAAEAFAAIAYAKPAGLGRVDHEDIWLPPTLTLKQAMALAAHRDRIARAYVTDFDDVFDFALPRLKRARAEAASPELAVTTLHMAALAAFDDSHIMRKHGAAVAADVRRAAESRRRLWEPVATPGAIEALLAFDAGLKARGVNPGTTADFVVAALFADQLASATRA